MKSFVVASALSLLPVMCFAETAAMVLEEDRAEQEAPQEQAAPEAAPVATATPAPAPAPVQAPAPVVKKATVAPVGITNFKIRQNIKSHRLIVIEASGAPIELSLGKIFLVNFEDGQQCSVVVKEISENLITADSSGCDRADMISTKLSVEPALIATPVVAKEVAPVKSEDVAAEPQKVYQPYARVAFNLYYSNAEEIKFDDSYASTSSGSGPLDVTFKVDRAVGVGLSVGRMQQNSWGFNFLGAIEGSREFKSGTISGAGGTYTGTFSTKPKMGILLGEAQLLYRWDQFYLPFGLNLSAIWINDWEVSQIDVRGGLGAVLGVGFMVTDHVAFELLARSIGIYLKETSGTDSIDYKYGTLSGAVFGFKYMF